MLLSRIRVSPQALFRSGSQGSEAYAVHQLLWKMFSDGPERKRDFLFRNEGKESGLSLLVLSERAPVDVPGGVIITSKHYEPILREGDTFEFTVRINPILRSKLDGKRHDVMMHAKKTSTAGGTIDTLITKWLTARQEMLGCTFLPNSTFVSSYSPEKFRKRGHTIALTICEVGGLLQVTRPELLQTALRAGIGSGKAFGCGLLLLRRVRSHACAA